MNARPFALNPVDFGLPSREQFAAYRIWDSYYFPRMTAKPGALLEDIAGDLRAIEPFAIERLCAYLHVGLGTLGRPGAASPAEDRAQNLAILERWPDRLLGVIHLNANDVGASLAALEQWVSPGGPIVGVCFKSNPPGCLVCTHPNFNPIVRRCAELGLLIMQHTWFKTAGKDDVGESTPAELAELARRHPDIRFVSAHAGGDWERGIRAVRECPNVLVETSGFNPTAGFIDLAVRELGADRIIYGGHLMGRSLATELSKVLSADISERDRKLIFGGNLRHLLRRIRPDA